MVGAGRVEPNLPRRSEDTETRPSHVIAGGIVAHNDERRIEGAIRSLLSQELPEGTSWGRIWVVASGCTDRTVDVARAWAAIDPRLALVVEPDRRGKSAALREVLHRAEGDSLVLLNSDAVAAPGAVAALLAKAAGKVGPFAVMARPTATGSGPAEWPSTMQWMWDFHHELHLEMLAKGRAEHLSDELFLVSLPAVEWIEDGIINDGSYCAVWLRKNSGQCWYAPEARVSVDVPATPMAHLHQRRRIHVGNAQVTARLGERPTTAARYLFREPSRTLGALRRSLDRELGPLHLARVSGWEIVAHMLALWDRLLPRRDYVRWPRVPTSGGELGTAITHSTSPAHRDDELERRIRILVEVAREFDSGVSLDELLALLPAGTLAGANDLEEFLARRPDLASVVGQRVFFPSGGLPTDSARFSRGLRYRRAAEDLVRGPLAWLLPWVRCIGVTGSAAYGQPAADDDLDFFVVTRTGAVPWFLAATFIILRLRRTGHAGERGPPACFNFVIDERRALTEFARGRGLLFAREALSAVMVHGEEYYRGLLARFSWMGGELPRLYEARTASAGDPSPRPTSWLLPLLSAMLFLPLAGYLQLAGLRRNASARRQRRNSAVFRTLTSLSRFAFQSQRFEELRVRYEGSREPSVGSTGGGPPSRLPTAR